MPWYFAYGTDLDWQTLEAWCRANSRRSPRYRRALPATLSNHRLCFPTYREDEGGGVADIVREPGKQVSGVLYDVSDSALKLLEQRGGRTVDRYGNETGPTRRLPIVVEPYDPTYAPVEAFALQCRAREWMQVPPSEVYLTRLINAAARRGLSPFWLMHLALFRPSPRPTPASPVVSTLPADRMSWLTTL